MAIKNIYFISLTLHFTAYKRDTNEYVFNNKSVYLSLVGRTDSATGCTTRPIVGCRFNKDVCIDTKLQPNIKILFILHTIVIE